ncbi:hypothetical protein NPIL_139511 [Nephila pilipes]|uniref:Uncharacterized protein n=1 Tax=Nephila pilipes TaxID=299642 RepID=A0A8X6KPP8_NEPPI|nr:hypothetical protein NPIL_139511 [Nephila pilipes]
MYLSQSPIYEICKKDLYPPKQNTITPASSGHQRRIVGVSIMEAGYPGGIRHQIRSTNIGISRSPRPGPGISGEYLVRGKDTISVINSYSPQ